MSSVEFIKMITAEAKCDGKDSNHSPKGNKLVMRKSLYGIAWRHILPFPLLALRPRDPTSSLISPGRVIDGTDHRRTC